MVLDLNGHELPFLFDLSRIKGDLSMVVHNGEEHIAVDEISLQGDSIRIRMPLFDSEFRGRVVNDSTLQGLWHNRLKGPTHGIPFTASAGKSSRFPGTASGGADISGQWHAVFDPGSADAYDAIGLFDQRGQSLAGTFATETGDYRFLDGDVQGDSLRLSCFDGAHAFLFKALHRNDSLVGRFWNGTGGEEPWVAVRDTAFRLRHPDSLTFMNRDHAPVDFRFPSIDGGEVGPADARYRGKVLLVQVMGSWCPNCVDESVLLQQLYDAHHADGLEVIAMAFEKHKGEQAVEALRQFRDRLGLAYTIVLAGPSSKEAASSSLPFLDRVKSYPTCIFMDRKGMVRRIHTGFYGPGTGEHYARYRRELFAFVTSLLAEPMPVPAPSDIRASSAYQR